MYKVHDKGVMLMLFYFLCLYMTLVACDNRTQYWQQKIEHMKLADSAHDEIGIKKISSPIPMQLVKYRQIKDIVTKGKGPTKSNKDKGLKGAKSVSNHTLQEKSTIKKNPNTTKNDLGYTKGILRLGNREKNDKWPRLQKPRLRDKESSVGSPRLTKMNMMQLDDPTTLPSPFTVNKFIAQDDNLNELISPYTIKQQMLRIGRKFNNLNYTVEVLGRTLEYNDIVLVKMTQGIRETGRFRADDKKYVDDTNEKKIIFIVHGLSVMGMVELDCLVEEKNFIRLVSYYLKHLDKFDIFLMPMANPDGYGYNKEMWNKNLSPQDACPGVALDRNFDIAWNVSRVISSCSQQYPGPAPFSEPESRAVRDVLHRYSHKIIAYIHVHAGTYCPETFKGDAVLYPRGFTDVQSDDDKYIDLKGEIDETMRKASFQIYSVTVDTLHSWYGKVAGTSVDYASTVYGIPYAMEFVMQLYEGEGWVKQQSAEDPSYHALVEVWKRVIDVVGNNIWNSLQSNEV